MEKEKKIRVVPFIIRALLFSFVAYKIYGETGLWTTLFSVFVYISLELHAFLSAFQLRSISDFMEGVMKKFEIHEKIFKVKSQEEMVEEEIIRRSKEN